MATKSIVQIRVAVLVAIAVAFSPRAHAEPIEANLEAALYIKILGFEQTIKGQAGTKVVIGVVHNGGERGSQMIRAINRLASTKNVRIHGKTLAAISVPIETLRERGKLASALYVAPDVARHAAQIASTAATNRLPSLAGSRSIVRDGIAIGVVPKGRRPGILINVRAARRAKLSFDPKLLRFAEILK